MSAEREAIDIISKIAADIGLFGASRRNSLIYWDPPKGWKGTPYLFGYTPWRTKDPETGKDGYFALKYRALKNGTNKLVKSVRFGRRKVAKARALKWYNAYYRSNSEES